MIMIFKKIELNYVEKKAFHSTSYDGIRHIKTLPYLSVVQAVEGNYDIQIGKGETYNTGVGGFFVAPSNVQQTIIHNADKISKNMVCRWVFLKIKINDVYNYDTLYDFPTVIPEAHKQEMNLLFDRLFASDNIFDEYICYYEIIRILSLISKTKKHTFPIHLDKAITYIKNNYKDKISVEDIAKVANLSESHLFSVFKKEIGISPITYLNNYRLSIAANELINTDKTVVEICDAVGITDSVYFNKMFRKAYQMPPSEYRKTYTNGRE